MTRLPDLGPRGEGWVAGQVVILTGIGIAGLAALPAAEWSGTLRVVEVGLGAIAIGLGALAGLRGLRDLGTGMSPFPRPTSANRLVESGAYTYVRHPVYAGLLLSSVGWGLVTRSLVVIGLALLLFVWFDMKSRREEAWLAARYPGYASYRARTKRFVPFVY